MTQNFDNPSQSPEPTNISERKLGIDTVLPIPEQIKDVVKQLQSNPDIPYVDIEFVNISKARGHHSIIREGTLPSADLTTNSIRPSAGKYYRLRVVESVSVKYRIAEKQPIITTQKGVVAQLMFVKLNDLDTATPATTGLFWLL